MESASLDKVKMIAKKMNSKIFIRVKNASVLDLITHFFMFISTLLIGADLLGVQVGVNIRIDMLFLFVTACLLIVNKKFTLKMSLSILALLVFSLLSAAFAGDVTRGIIYYFFIVYNVIFVFFLYSAYIYAYGSHKFMKIYRYGLYLQFFIFLVQYGLKIAFDLEIPFLPTYGEYFGIPRFRLWFYEPSYMATFMLFWFTLSSYMWLIAKNKSFLKDVIMSGIMIVLCTSSSGYIGAVLAIAIIYLLWLKQSITVYKLCFLVLVFALFLVFRFAMSDIYEVFISRLFKGSLDSASGGRITGWSETWEVFQKNVFFGVGPGNYGEYLGMDNDYMPTNITLEIFATLGIFGAIAYIAIHISVIWHAFRVYKKNPRGTRILMAMIAGFIIFIIILQFNQGYLRLYHWMFLGMMDGTARYCSKTMKIIKRYRPESWSNENNLFALGV